MLFHAFYDEVRDCIVFYFESGPLSRSVDSYISTAKKMGTKHRCTKILTNIRDADMDLGVSDLCLLADKMAREGLDEEWRRAIVVSSGTPEAEFYENYNNSKGLPVRVFIDEDEAVTWLNRRNAS